MKKFILCLGLVAVLVQPVMAWIPSSWVYFNYPYAYEQVSGNWYWFNTQDTQWAYEFVDGGGWQHLDASALVNGWSFLRWPYAYCKTNGSWYYMNEVDGQWVVNLSSGVWTVFGILPAPVGMVTIPAGTNGGTMDYGITTSTYSLTVTSFYMDKYEVTKSLWDEVFSWAITNGYSFDNAGGGKATNHPVHTISWLDTIKWCNARSEKEGLAPAYYRSSSHTSGHIYRAGQIELQNDMVRGDTGYRLPMTHQWEYAAMGGLSGNLYPWGNSITHDHANVLLVGADGWHPFYNDGIPPYTSPVGSFAPNGFGLYDMAGNVWEWLHHVDYSSSYLRGGSWDTPGFFCKVNNGVFDLYIAADHRIGFRTVLPPGKQ